MIRIIPLVIVMIALMSPTDAHAWRRSRGYHTEGKSSSRNEHESHRSMRVGDHAGTWGPKEKKKDRTEEKHKEHTKKEKALRKDETTLTRDEKKVREDRKRVKHAEDGQHTNERSDRKDEKRRR